MRNAHWLLDVCWSVVQSPHQVCHIVLVRPLEGQAPTVAQTRRALPLRRSHAQLCDLMPPCCLCLLPALGLSLTVLHCLSLLLVYAPILSRSTILHMCLHDSPWMSGFCQHRTVQASFVLCYGGHARAYRISYSLQRADHTHP